MPPRREVVVFMGSPDLKTGTGQRSTPAPCKAGTNAMEPSGEMWRGPRRLLARRPAVCVDLAPVCGHCGCADHRLRAEYRQSGKQCGASALSVGAGLIELEMMMVTRIVLSAVAPRSARNVRIAQDDREPPVDGR